jgi:hypothetical protein
VAKWDYLADASVGWRWAAALGTNPGHRYVPSSVEGPVITSLSVVTGPLGGGTAVILTGTGFTGGFLVTFGGIACTTAIFTSDTLITAITPAGLAAGLVDVRVVTPQGASRTLDAAFTYTAGAGPVDGLLAESGDFLTTESGDYIVWEP